MTMICQNCIDRRTPDGVVCPDCGCSWQSYDMGYVILDNGDIVTSDGEPRSVDELQLKMVAEKAAKAGREIEFRFRKALPGEFDE